MVMAAKKLKDFAPWKKMYDKPRQHFKKQRHYFANKGPNSQSFVFISSVEVMISIHRIPVLLCFLVNIWIIFTMNMKVKVKVAQLCPSLWHPEDYTVHGILQAKILEWVAFPFSRGSSQPRDQSKVSLIAGGFFTSWATWEVQEYWSG